MPNLFPAVGGSGSTAFATGNETIAVKFGKSWRFDWAAGEFAMTPSGKIAETTGADAWLEWCKKAIATERFRSLIYGRNYGSEFEALIARHLPRGATSSEIKRIATETLMTDRRTAKVGNFAFHWEGDQCYFTCEVESVRGTGGAISGKVVV